MFGRIAGVALLGAVVAAVVYEILDREKPELAEKIKGWFTKEDDFFEPEEAPAE